jgi:hypothetical protein
MLAEAELTANGSSHLGAPPLAPGLRSSLFLRRTHVVRQSARMMRSRAARSLPENFWMHER